MVNSQDNSQEKFKKSQLNLRQKMIREIKEKYDLDSPGVFFAMNQVPREEFIPSADRQIAYEDEPIYIGFGQTISQPYTVAVMTDLIVRVRERVRDKKTKGLKVLEIGTGSGYQAAILSFLFNQVYTVERIKPLHLKAKRVLRKLGYKNIFCKLGQGEIGWKEKAPFDAIMITAGMEKVPQKLFNQLKIGGVLVAPVGEGEDKEMIRFTKNKGSLKKETFGIFHFVPLIEKKD